MFAPPLASPRGTPTTPPSGGVKRRWFLTLPLLLAGSGCFTGEPEFVNKQLKLACEIQTQCFGAHPSRKACVEQNETIQGLCDDTGSYDGYSARQCLNHLREQKRNCPASAAEWRLPSACANVCSPP